MNTQGSLEDAAMVLKALPPNMADRIVHRLQPQDRERLVDRLKQLSPPAALELAELVANFRLQIIGSHNGTNSTEPAASKTTCDSQWPRPSSKSTSSQQPFGYLLQLSPQARAELLSDEHPRHIAVVLSTLKPHDASETMKSFEDQVLRLAVLKRLCELEEIDSDDLNELSFALKLRFNRLAWCHQSSGMGLKAAAEMLSCSDDATKQTLLEHFAQVDSDLAKHLKKSVIDIGILEALNLEQRKAVLANVDTALWAPALKRAPSSVTSAVMSAMAKPAGRILSEEIDAMLLVDPDEENRARVRIVETILRLMRQGDVELAA